jgi:hypothetical protein
MSEKLKDILEEMHDFSNGQEKNNYYDLREMGTDAFRAYADRIEAAYKADLAEAIAAKCEVCDQVAVAKSATTTATCKKSLPVGSEVK